jgi:uncharacterized protein (DUF1800 family)
MSAQYFQAAARFGLGARPDQPIQSNPQMWLLAQIDGYPPQPPLPAGFDHVPTVADGFRVWRERDNAGPISSGQRSPVDTYFIAESIAAYSWRLDTSTPYLERLIDFWTNHFTISRRAGTQVTVTVPSFVRDVIRPHVTGRFADMLVAAFKHPSMLGYLDQNASVGPNSRFGIRSGRGLNENLAREILELHTVSVAAGYTQKDVTEFARLLTGWGFERDKEPFGTTFRIAAHEPGSKELLGHRFEAGEESAEKALRFLAEHPATYFHIATKLAKHFVSDFPPTKAVAKLEKVLLETEGDLGAIARTLPILPEAWDPPLSKLRNPADYVTAVYRACGASGERYGEAAFKAASGLGQQIWSALQPNGWSDQGSDWLAPEAAMQRLDWAFQVAGHFSSKNPMAVLNSTLGSLAPRETLQAIRGAGSPQDALALLFASAEFQRR